MRRVCQFSLAAALLLAAAALCACGDEHGGGAQKTKGQVESGVGSFLGDSHLKREGKKDEVVGGFKKTATDLKQSVHDALH
jgi:uncharacterized protein YjbJ (UPF0337 family)